MRSRVLVPLMIAAVLALSPHTGASAVTVEGADDGDSAPMPMAVLSSFTAETRGASIVGGTRTVTVHNFSTTDISTSVDLGPAPCTCTIAHFEASHGTVSGSLWKVEALPGARTATLTIEYSSGASESVAIRTHSRAPAVIEESAGGDALVRTVVRPRHIPL